MGRCTRYCKEELLDMLHEHCPEAVAKLPSPDSFTFQASHHGTSELRIGSYIKGRRSPTTHELWVRCGGTAKPWLGFDIEIDHKGFYGDAFFKKMTKSGKVHVYSNELKAMVAFIFVYCDKMEEFCDFDNGKGSKILVKELQNMFPKDQNVAVSEDVTEHVRSDTVNASDARSDLVKSSSDKQPAEKQFAESLQKSSHKLLSKRPKKRSLGVETDDRFVEKKARLD
jgi:hypothetical protein